MPHLKKEKKNIQPVAEAKSSADSLRLLAIVTIIVVALSIIPRIFGIFSDFWLDEIWSYFRLLPLKSPIEIFTKFRSDNNHFLNSLFMFLIGDTGHWYRYRLLSLTTGLLTIPLVWISMKKTDRAEACIATILTAASYLLINFSSEARGYAAVVFFSAAAWYCLQRRLSNRSLTWAILLWFSICLGLLSHLTFLFVFVAAAIWLPYDRMKRHEGWASIAKEWLTCFGVPVAFSACFYVLVVSRIRVVGGPEYNLLDILAETFSYTGGEGQFVNQLTIAWGLVTAGLIGWSLFLLWKRGRSEWLFLLTVIFLAPAAALMIHRPQVLFVRYFLIDIFFGYIALSFLLADFLKSSKLPARVAVMVFLAVFLAGNGFQAARLMEFGRGGYRQAMQFIGETTPWEQITLISDHPVRNGKLVDFYKRFLPPKKDALLLTDYPPSSPPDWIILHSTDEPPRFTEHVKDGYGNLYTQRKLYQYAGPSGWCWAIYSR